MNNTHQNGAVLITSLLMLVVLTLLAVSSIRASSVNLLIVDNMQSQKYAESLAQRGIVESLSDTETFRNPAARTYQWDDVNVNVSQAACIDKRVAMGYSIRMGRGYLPPEDTIWEFSASVANAGNGAGATLHQGVQLRMTSGNC